MSRPQFEDDFGGNYLLIEAGDFLCGDVDGSGLKRERPCQNVVISDLFFISARPVTQMHWQAVMGSNPSRFQDGWAAGLRPVESVSWHDALEFIDKLNELEQGKERLGLTGRWRLPSEVEWEYCARSGTKSRWHFGDSDTDLNDHGWHAGNSGATTREVGQKKANEWGLSDMHGNVSEWCQDDFESDYSGGLSQQPKQNDSGVKVHRGGSWFTESDATRAAARSKANADKSSDGIGLRLVWQPL